MRGLEECVAYFKNDSGFERLVEGLYDLYARYERCFGAVRLVRPLPEEERAISVFFKRDYYNQALIRIGLADFERQVQKVFSADIKLEALLEGYFCKRLTSRSGPRNVGVFSVFVENHIMPRYMGTHAELWLREVSTHVRRAYRLWADRFVNEPDEVEAMLVTVCGALNNLPVWRHQTQRLTDFAQSVTGDAYHFDMSSPCGMLLLRALSRAFEQNYPSTAEECGTLYYKAGLLSEGVLNFVAVRGLRAYCGDEADEASAAYGRRNEAHWLTLENTDRFQRLEAYGGKVFIMENLTVFSAVNERLRDCPCTLLYADDGMNPALTRLLRLFCDSGAMLYYSGDMDYTGLCAADKLYLAYPKNFVPWRYAKADYERIISDSDFFVPENKKDIGLHNEDLASLLSMMRKKGKTAPQSALIPDLVADIRNMVGL